MRRALWEMPDNEIAALLDRAIMVLDGLYVQLSTLEDIAEFNRTRRDSFKKRSPEWHKFEQQFYFARQQVLSCEQRVLAQQSIVQSFQNEMTARNPPFWTRYDLDRINRQR